MLTHPSLALFASLSLATFACGADDPAPVDVDAPPAGTGFRIETPPIDIAPGQEATYCYYTSVPTDAAVGVKRWSSTMTPGSHHLTLFFADSASPPDGTVDQNCGAGVPYWVYAAQQPTAEQVMPTGVGVTVPARQKIYIQLHYVNTSDAVIHASARVDAETYAAGEAYTPAAAFVTYRSGFTVPARGTASTGGACAVPPDARFFAVSTHTHRLGVHTAVRDGDAMVFESTDWEHPGVRGWDAEPFYRFASGRLTYACDYDNPRDTAVSEGASAVSNEMCMAIAYYVPATAPTFCFNDTVVR